MKKKRNQSGTGIGTLSLKLAHFGTVAVVLLNMPAVATLATAEKLTPQAVEQFCHVELCPSRETEIAYNPARADQLYRGLVPLITRAVKQGADEAT